MIMLDDLVIMAADVNIENTSSESFCEKEPKYVIDISKFSSFQVFHFICIVDH